MKKVIVTQSNYIPWKGYFDSFQLVDEVILLDEVQFTKRDWRNRNQIKTPQGSYWLTIPVDVAGKFSQSIWETMISDREWAKSHWKTIRQNYCKAPFFEKYSAKLEEFYLNNSDLQLSLINRKLLELVNECLAIRTPITWSHDYGKFEGKNQRLIEICKKANASDYFSGPAAKDYLDEKLFGDCGIRVHWLDYSGYPEYPQLYGEFTHQVSVLDLLFNTGDRAQNYMKHGQGGK